MKDIKPIRVYPIVFSIGPTEMRPAMIFSDDKGDKQLPVWFDPVEARNVIVQQNSLKEGVVSRAVHGLLKALAVDITSVYFNEIEGKQQFASVLVKRGGATSESIRMPASEAAALTLTFPVEYYTNGDIIENSRSLYFEWLLTSWKVDKGVAQKNEGMH